MKHTKNKKKLAIVWANPYNSNLGVGALAYSALALIKDVMDEHNIDSEISIIGSVGKTGKEELVINNKRISFNCYLGLDHHNWKFWVKSFLKPSSFYFFKLSKYDCVYDIAEGDSFSDIYSEKRFYKILNSKRLFDKLGVRQVLLPQTIGPFKNPVVEKAAFEVMSKLYKVISRDKKSYDYTFEHLNSERIEESIDVAFYMPFERIKPENDKLNVGINVSGLLWNGGYTRNNQFNMKTDYQDLIKKVLSFFTKRSDVQVHLIPHVIPDNMPVEDDYLASEELKKEFPNVLIAPRFSNPIEAKSYISGMDFFSGGRMHSCIAAFSSGVPVVPMAYSRKFNGLFGDTLKYSWMGDCVNTETEVVLNKIIEGFEKRDLLAINIKESEKNVITPRLKRLKAIILESVVN